MTRDATPLAGAPVRFAWLGEGSIADAVGQSGDDGSYRLRLTAPDSVALYQVLVAATDGFTATVK